MLRPYIRVVRNPGVATPLAASFLGSLPIGMLNLSVVLLTRSATGSFATAGTVAASLGVGSAVGMIVQGSLIDRLGQPRVLVPSGIICALALVALVLTSAVGGPTSVAAAALLAGVGGLTIPAVPSAMRVLLPRLINSPQQRMTGYAWLAVQHQSTAVLGPLVVSGLVLVAPAAAVLGTAALAAGASIVFASTRGARDWRPTTRRSGWLPRGWHGSGMRTLLAGFFCVGVVGGLTGVGLPAVAADHSVPALAGVLLAASATGSIVGGVAFGARSWQLSMPNLLTRLYGVNAIAELALWLLVLLAVRPSILLPLLLVLGAIGAPIGILNSTLVDRVAANGAITESYTTLIATNLAGIAAGNYVAGQLIELVGTHAVFAVGAVILASATGWVLARHGTLERTDVGGVD